MIEKQDVIYLPLDPPVERGQEHTAPQRPLLELSLIAWGNALYPRHAFASSILSAALSHCP